MDSAQVGVLKKSNEVGLTSLLKSSNSRALKPQVGLEILSNLTDEPLEGELPDEQLGGLLVTPDLTESDSSRPVTVRLLDSSSSRSTLTSSFGGQLLSGSLSSCGLPSGLLGTSHFL